MNHYHELSISLHKATDDEMKLAISLLEAELSRRKLMELKLESTSSWITWSGGKCPVTANTDVEVKVRDGEIMRRRADAFDWLNIPTLQERDIIAYRVVS